MKIPEHPMVYHMFNTQFPSVSISVPFSNWQKMGKVRIFLQNQPASEEAPPPAHQHFAPDPWPAGPARGGTLPAMSAGKPIPWLTADLDGRSEIQGSGSLRPWIIKMDLIFGKKNNVSINPMIPMFIKPHCSHDSSLDPSEMFQEKQQV